MLLIQNIITDRRLAARAIWAVRAAAVIPAAREMPAAQEIPVAPAIPAVQEAIREAAIWAAIQG